MQQGGLAGPPRHDVVDFERDPDAEQQRQCNDVREIELEPDQYAELEGHHAGKKQRYQGQGHIAEPPQHDPK